MFRKLASAILVAGVLGSSQAGALGLGELTLHSALNEPLDAEIKLLSVGDLGPEQVIVHLGSQEDFERAGVDRDYFLTNFKFEVQLDGKGNGAIHIRTNNLVNEPYLNFIIEARWPAGKLLREYTALLDLPVYTERPAAQVNLGAAPGRSGPTVSRSATPTTASVSASSTSAAPSGYSGGDSYEIRRADTLWKIAQQTRPAGDVSVQQTMLAIQQLNPDAFINGNINLLREGAVLRLPSADQARQTSTDAARSEVATQSRAWRQKVESGGESADTLPVVREPQAESDGRLTLSSASSGSTEGSGAGGAGDEQLKGKLNQSLENLDRAERDNADLKSRVTEMQGQVEKLQRLVQLKDEQLAALQKRAAESAAAPKSEPQAEVAPPPADAPVTAPAQPEQATTPAPAAEAPAQPEPAPTAEPPVEAPAPVGEAAPVQEAAPAAPAPKPVAKPPAAPEPDLLETILGNPLYLGLGGGLVVLILLGLVLRQRAAQREAEAALASQSHDEPAFDQSFDEVDEPIQQADAPEATAESGYDEDDTIEQPVASTTRSETGDAIGEADIYVAYGRYQHAIDLLKNAIASEPGRSDLRVKLLEVYLEAGDRDGFRSQFAALQALGDADATGRAKELLMSVDDGNAWIGEATAFDPNATIPLAPAVSRADNDRLDSDTTMERPAITDDDLADLDLDDELEETDTSWTTTDEPDELPAVDTTTATASLDDLDLDLGLDEDLDSGSDSALEPLEDEELALNADDLLSEDTLVLADGNDLDEPLDLVSDTEFELATTESDVGGGSLDELEEDVELALDADLEPEVADTGFTKNVDDIDAEIGAFDAESLQAAADLNDGDEEEFDFLSDSDEVATKLDLARAYIDMGDIDGARDILQEVLQEGEAQQKDEANKLLARIA